MAIRLCRSYSEHTLRHRAHAAMLCAMSEWTALVLYSPPTFLHEATGRIYFMAEKFSVTFHILTIDHYSEITNPVDLLLFDTRATS